MWQANPHGFGVMARKDNELPMYIKGVMDCERAIEIVQKLREADTSCREAALHFRIATHGVIDAGNTHPFIRGANVTDQRALSGSGKLLVMHNGILDFPHAKHSILSDSARFAQTIMVQLMNIRQATQDVLLENFAQAQASRFVTMDSDKTRTYGSWQKEDGIMYSNMGWKTGTYSTMGGGKRSHSSWSYEESPDNDDFEMADYWISALSNFADYNPVFDWNHAYRSTLGVLVQKNRLGSESSSFNSYRVTKADLIEQASFEAYLGEETDKSPQQKVSTR
jgi:hypothetical protein